MKQKALTALLLVAGSSRRFGSENKLLEQWNRIPVCVHALNSLLESSVDSILIVTGYQQEAVQSTLSEYCTSSSLSTQIRFVHNPSYEEGMGSSVLTGLRHISTETEAVLVCLGDMPAVSPAVIDTMCTSWHKHPGYHAYAPEFGDRRGNPVLLTNKLFKELGNVTGDLGARELLNKYEKSVLSVPVTTEAVLLDIDVESDLVAIKNRS